ncbi:hypothetical protein ACI2JA_04115 [Alkalihalobacillus sp. NPDC078783]
MALIADVFEMLVIDKDGDVLAKDWLTEANITLETAENEVRAGRGNSLYAILHGDKNIEITSNTPEFQLEHLAKHLGTDIVTGAGTAFASTEDHTVTEVDGLATITLKKAPLSEKYLSIKGVGGKKIPKANMIVSGKEVQFSSGVEAGDKVRVETYEYATPASTKQVDITIDQFPKNVRIVLTTLKLDRDAQPVSEIQFDYENVKPSANMTINTASERDASAQEATYRVMLPENSKKLGTIKEIPIDETP